MLMILPHLLLSINGATILLQRNVPFTLMDMIQSHCSSLTFRMPPGTCTPALFTRMSTLPNFAVHSLSVFSISSAREMSIERGRQFPPASLIKSAVTLTFSRFRPTATTAAPSAAKERAMPLPRPDPAPVTSATRPLSTLPTSSPPTDCPFRHRSLCSQARVKFVAQPIAKNVHGDHRNRDGGTGKGREPPRGCQIVPSIAEHPSPVWRKRVATQAQEAQPRRDDDHVCGFESGHHDDSRGNVRKDVPRHDASVRPPSARSAVM